jgi:hypothetical protein
MGQATSQYNHGQSDERPSGLPAGGGRVQDRGRSGMTVAIFADRGYLRAEMAEDAAAAGLRVEHASDLERLSDQPEAASLGDLVLVDCPVIDGAELAALAQLDMRVAKAGSQLVVSTSMGSLDDVFGCLDQSEPQILVTPSRAERVIALGRVLARAGNRVRELSEDDRLALLRLTEQVGQIAQKLEQLSSTAMPPSAEQTSASAFRFDGSDYGGKLETKHDLRGEDSSERLVRTSRPPLPDPRLVRKIIRQRQLRARFFEGDIFADPAWDMLLDLTAARAEHVRVSVTSLCIASGVPPTTALRWIGQMTDAALMQRVDDETDRRRAFITLTDKAADAMARYFAELGAGSATLI